MELLQSEIRNQAIKNLRPSAEYVITDGDYSTVQWIVLDGEAPSQKELNDEIKKINAAMDKAEADKATAKASAQTKLAALGLTEEEITSILG